MSIIVCDTCSLIKLKKGGVLGALGDFYQTVYIPQAVEMEFTEKTRKEIINLSFIKVLNVRHVLPIGMGKGEREAISLCVENNILDIMTDDEKAFKNSLRQNLKPITAFNFLVIAKYIKSIKAVKPVLDEMKIKGEGIPDSLYFQTLKNADEL